MENKPHSAEGQVKQKRKYKKKQKLKINGVDYHVDYHWKDINFYIMGKPIKGIVYHSYATEITVEIGFINGSGERAPNDRLK